MRIGFLIDRWEPRRGGAEAAMWAFAAHLTAVGHEVIAIAGRGGPDPSGIPVEKVGEARGLAKLLPRGVREKRLAKALQQRAVELGCERTVGARHLTKLSMFWPHGGAHQATLTARTAARASAFGPIERADLPRGAEAQGQERGRHRTFLDLEAKLANGGADSIVCVSDMVHQEFVQRYPACKERLSTVPNGVDLNRFRPWYGERATIRARLGPAFAHDDGAPILAFIAREPELKGLPALTRALAQMLDRPWRLVVAGPRDFSAVERYLLPFGPAQQAPLSDGSRFAARWVFMPQVDSHLLLRASNLCVQPTWRDPCSLVTFESLATGRRVLTTLANGAATEVLAGEFPPSEQRISTSERGSVLFDAADESLLARALCAELDRDSSDDQIITRRISISMTDFERSCVFYQLERLLLNAV